MSTATQTLSIPSSGQAKATPRWVHFLRCSGTGFLNFGGAQVIRLAGNLILTRLLVPEAFGLMTLANVFLVGLQMFSDMGLGPSIIQRSVPLNKSFLQTAWTLQIVRGFSLFALVSLAAIPLSNFYSEPILLALIPAIAFRDIILGFRSIQFFVEEKELRHLRPTLINLGTALLGLIAAIFLTFVYPNVWALVLSGLIAALANTLATHIFLPGFQHKFKWDKKALHELIHFGKWIMLSTTLAFLATQGDRLLLGKYLSPTELGIYTVAFFFAQSVTSLIGGVTNRVMLPLLSKARKESVEAQRKIYNRYRSIFLALATPILGFFITLGAPLIHFLYDARYQAAGPMLEILALGAAAAVLRSLIQPALLSQGNSFLRMVLSAFEASFILVCMALGGALGELSGFLWGWVAGQLLATAAGYLLLLRYRLLSFIPDCLFILTLAIAYFLSNA